MEQDEFGLFGSDSDDSGNEADLERYEGNDDEDDDDPEKEKKKISVLTSKVGEKFYSSFVPTTSTTVHTGLTFARFGSCHPKSCLENMMQMNPVSLTRMSLLQWLVMIDRTCLFIL